MTDKPNPDEIHVIDGQEFTTTELVCVGISLPPKTDDRIIAIDTEVFPSPFANKEHD